MAQQIEIPSQRYGKYRLRSRLGEGGMAEVFLAEVVNEKGEQAQIALKLMREGVSDEAFADEADLMGLLSHPNLVQRLEVGSAFGRRFIAMEFLVGGDLEEVMAAHRRDHLPFPNAFAIHITLEVLRALAYFHQARTRTGTPLNLVHGDVNPANVFFSGKGEVKLGDFGVAKSRSLDLGPEEGVAAGKLYYLSPEQTRGETLMPPSDLFSVGVMLHELVVGFHPFKTKEARPEVVMATIRAARLSLPGDIDRRLAQVLKRALHADPDERYQSAGEFGGDLFRYALDANLYTSPPELAVWLEEVLGLVV